MARPFEGARSREFTHDDITDRARDTYYGVARLFPRPCWCLVSILGAGASPSLQNGPTRGDYACLIELERDGASLSLQRKKGRKHLAEKFL